MTCLYRDCECKVTSFSSAPIPWPRVQPVEYRGGSGLWVNDDLKRAIRTESAAALMHWFGVGANAAWAWRKAFGVAGRARTTPGTRRAVRAAAVRGAEAVKAKEWTPAERKARSRLAKRQGRKFPPRWTPESGGWTAEQLALLGTDHDEATAKRLGRTISAVTSRRVALKVPAFAGWPGGGRGWTDEELALLGMIPDAELAERLDRTPGAVTQKRLALGVPAHSGWRGGGRAWTAGEEALLGTDRDSAVAARLGRSPNAVALRRRALGVPAFGGRAGGRGWTKPELRLLGTDSDEAVAKRIGRTPGAVTQRRCAVGIAAAARRRG